MQLLLEFLFDSNKISLDRSRIMTGIPLEFFLTMDINPICMNVTFHSCQYLEGTLYPFCFHF